MRSIYSVILVSKLLNRFQDIDTNCGIGRPCKNCVKRGVGDTCADVERKRAKYLSEEPKENKSNSKRKHSTTTTESSRNSSTDNKFTPILPNVVQDKTIFPDLTSLGSPCPSLQSRDQLPQQQQQQQQQSYDRHGSTASPQITRLISESQEFSPQPKSDVFSSLFANQEYSQLTDILDASGAGPDTPASSGSNAPVFNTEFQTSFQTDNNTRPYISLSDNSNSTGTSQNIPNLMLNNDRDYTSPLIIRHMIKTPEDVYNTQIQSYNYPKAYHALLNYLKTRFNKDQLIKIAEFMADYRPSFIAATRSLVEMDLLFAERSFQRSLLEYESMSSLSSSPTIMWRRTGEIVAVSTEFSSLTTHSKASLLSKRTFIIELMNDSSALDYFKLFSSVAFGDLNGVIITECTLLSPNAEPIRCASTWTVKRDVFDIPMLIVGQFLPILQVR